MADTVLLVHHEIAFAQHLIVGSLDLNPTWSRDHDVKHQAVGQRREREPPWRAQLRSAIQRAAHAQAVQCFAERLD